MSVRISKLPLTERDRFLAFVRKTNPRRFNPEQRFLWQMTENPHLTDKESPPAYVATDKDNNIVGHFLLVPFGWYVDGKDFSGYWGVDYYVAEKSRGMAGALLAMQVIRGNQPYFTIDPSEVAKQIAFRLGAKPIGHLQRSIWFASPLARLKLHINRVLLTTRLKRVIPFYITRGSAQAFPEFLDGGPQLQFVRCSTCEEWVDYQWSDTVGFARSPAFIHWRFFSCFKRYSFYRLKGSSRVYFVARLAKWNGLIVLVLVDYRLPYGDENSWQAIVQAAKNLAKLNRCEGVVTMYSHAFFESVLNTNGFCNDDKPLLVISSAGLKMQDHAVDDGKPLFATMADCDIDINFGK